MAIISPKAEKAKNALVERAKAGKTGGSGEEEGGLNTDRAGEEIQKDLPESEYKDFLGTYEDEKWWLIVKKEDSPDKKVNKHMASDAISEKSGDDDEKDDVLSQANEDIDSPKFSEISKDRASGEDEEKDEFPPLDDALGRDFNINDYSTLKQRFSDINRQPRKVVDLYPAPLFLLSKRTKRCKVCKFQIIKPNINPTSNEPLRVNFPMINNIPKVTIYKISRYTPGSPVIDVMLQFRNPNMGQALVSFVQLTAEQVQEARERDPAPFFQIELPRREFKIDPSETYLDTTAQSTTG